MARRLFARESTGYWCSFTLDAEAGDITGWTFAASFARQFGVNDFTLGMAATAAAQGFFITNGPGREYQMNILPATLQAVPDTTSSFRMFADIIATLPDGSRVLIEDLDLTVSKGPTA